MDYELEDKCLTCQRECTSIVSCAYEDEEEVEDKTDDHRRRH